MHRTHTPRRSATLCASLAVVMILSYATVLARAAVLPAAQVAAAQTAEREKLLNGLSFFLLPQPATDKITIRLRIHSGAAFDLAGKEGTAALLARSLFPDETTRTYVGEELGGSLVVAVDHDKLDVTLAGRTGTLPVLLELLRNALVTGGAIDAKTLDSIRARHLADLNAQKAAASIADEMIARRLFGAYPLGRPTTGTAASMNRIERADLIDARTRFVAPDNATLAIVGNFDPARARILMRQYLGAWRKADRLARATFRQPVAPSPEVLVVPVTGAERVELRLAQRAPSRVERDHPAALVLARILEKRLASDTANASEGRGFGVRYVATKLAGALTVHGSARPADAAATLKIMRDQTQKLISNASSAAEFAQARAEARAAQIVSANDPTPLLDADTYGATASDVASRLDALMPADVQQLAARLFDSASTPPAIIAAGDEAMLDSLRQNGAQIEVLNASASPDAAPLPARLPNRSREVPQSPLIPGSPSAIGKAPNNSAPAAKTPNATPVAKPNANRP